MERILTKELGLIEVNEANKKALETIKGRKNDTFETKSDKPVRANVKRVGKSEPSE